MVCSVSGNDAPVTIHQRVSLSAAYLESGKRLSARFEDNEMAYLVQIEGHSKINNIELNEKDAMEIISEDIEINAQENSHLLLIKMKKQLE